MKLKVLLIISAIFMALLGLGQIFAPEALAIGYIPEGASEALIAYLRGFGGATLGIAVLNWVARNSEPSTARNAIVLGNTVGYGLTTIFSVWVPISSGKQFGIIEIVFLLIMLLFTSAFIWVGRASMSVTGS
jgi:apolipoprotein N-acyltransferase